MPRLAVPLLALALATAAPVLADDEGWEEEETIGGPDEGAAQPTDDDGWDDEEDLGAPPEPAAPTAEPECKQPESFVRITGEFESRLAIDTSFESSAETASDGTTRLEGKEDVLEWRNRLTAQLEGALFKNLNFRFGARATHLLVAERSEDDPFLLVNGEHYKGEFAVELREAYIDWLRIFGVFDLRVGNQIVAWGANEGGLSPADRVNPTDMTAMLAGDDDNIRLPVFAAKADLYLWEMKGELVWVPFFKSSRMMLWGHDFSFLHALPSTGDNPFAAGTLGQLAPLFELFDESKEDKLQEHLITTELPDENLATSQVAFRLSGSAGPVDLAASVWYGYDQIPRFRFDPALSRLLAGMDDLLGALDQMGELGELMEARCGTECDIGDLTAIYIDRPELVEGLIDAFPALKDVGPLVNSIMAGELPLRSHHARMFSVAAEMSWLIDPVMLKIDIGFTPGRTLYTDQFIAVERTMLQTVVGLDYSYGQDFIVGVSAFHFSILDRGKAIDPATGNKTDRDEEYIFFEPHSVGLAGQIEYNFGDDLEFKIRLVAMYEIMVTDFMLMPEFTYAYDDNLSLAVGAILLEAEPLSGKGWFTGNDKRDRPMGYFSNNDQVYLEIRYASEGRAVVFEYDEPLYRPPSEADSAIVQATLGCSHNRCAFCLMYKGKQFRARPRQAVLDDLDSLSRFHPRARRVFLADGDALVLSTERLLEIVGRSFEIFPSLQRVTSYANPANLLNKSVEDLTRLRQAGLNLLYVGLESGDDEILRRIDKGATKDEVVSACSRARQAGIEVSVTVLLGLGGTERSETHARATAAALTEISPEYASALTLMLGPFEPSFAELATPWTAISPRGALAELEWLVEGLVPSAPCVFRTNHASNYLPLRGTLPEDREALLEVVRAARADPTGRSLRPEWSRGL